ncbi:unnamed protein product [Closterium sp. NIES-64]|nr:unnamed protein product [Closterium sp. NIES-64]
MDRALKGLDKLTIAAEAHTRRWSQQLLPDLLALLSSASAILDRLPFFHNLPLLPLLPLPCSSSLCSLCPLAPSLPPFLVLFLLLTPSLPPFLVLFPLSPLPYPPPLPGIIVYSPLRAHITRPGMKVGVIGIGGLGHLALQIVRAMGAHVTAFSTSPSKEEEAKRMGAQQFVVYDAQAAPGKGHPEVPKSAHVDVLVNCAPVLPPQGDYRNFMSLLRPDGTLVLTGIPPDAVGPVGLLDLIFRQKKLAGSVVGGRMLLKEMFDFCATNSIKPVTVVSVTVASVTVVSVTMTSMIVANVIVVFKGVGGRVLVGVSSIVHMNRAACAALSPPFTTLSPPFTTLSTPFTTLSPPFTTLYHLQTRPLLQLNKAMDETRPLSQLNEAMDDVLANKVRYCVVLLTDAE